MPAGPLDELVRELRTREANGDGTDVRLVLLEVVDLAGQLDRLDAWVAMYAGRMQTTGLITGRDGRRDLQRVLGERELVDCLVAEWAGLDLQEVTTRTREACELVDLLLSGARP